MGQRAILTRGQVSGGGGAAREALLEAAALVRGHDEALQALEAIAHAQPTPAEVCDGFHIVVAKAAALVAGNEFGGKTQVVRVWNQSDDTPRFARLLRSTHRTLPSLRVDGVRYPAGALECSLRWRPRPAAVAIFMHIGKAGGTAFREALVGRLSDHPFEAVLQTGPGHNRMGRPYAEFDVGRLRWKYTKSNKHEFGDGRKWEHHLPELLSRLSEAVDLGRWTIASQKNAIVPCVCTEHFDYSLVRPIFQALPHGSVAALAMVRDPVRRFLSHFYYARRQPWTEGLPIRTVSPFEFLSRPDALLDSLMVWQDGVAGVSWFAGETVHYGMGAAGDFADNARLRVSINNRTATLQKAVRNYHKFVFVGLLEELTVSMELLQFVMSWESPLKVERRNAANPPNAEPTPREMDKLRAALRVLAPMDMWFYEYVRADFRARVAGMRGLRQREQLGQGRMCHNSSRGRLEGAPLARLPSEQELGGCVATREALACGADVFAKPGTQR